MFNPELISFILFNLMPPFIIITFIWHFISTKLLIRRKGKIKRGIKIWSEPLPGPIYKFLRNLSHDVVEHRQFHFFSIEVGFIRVKDREVLVQYRRERWRTSWPLVGYVDLRKPDLEIKYRASLPSVLLFFPFIFIGFMNLPVALIALSFITIVISVSFYIERNAILGFIQRQASAENRDD